VLLLSESGVWRRLKKWKIRLRRTRSHITSPDEHYREKVALLRRVQELAARGEVVLLYGDEHTYYRQPLAAQVWHEQGGAGKRQPRCVRHTASDTKRRTIAALNAQTGQVHWHGCSKSRLHELCLFLRQLRRAYPQERVVLVWDNWPVHLHEKVLLCASEQQIGLVFLPTYSPWLNPIEKLWKWLKHDVLTVHRNSAHWTQLREEVEQFLDRFNKPSSPLLRYCGLLAD
jgi:putative transposase